jgi:hypothetical protein
MTRVVLLKLDEGAVVVRCLSEKVAVSAIESLPGGGTRLVCKSSDGAEIIRTKLKAQLIKGDVTRARYRPTSPLW